MNAQVQDVFPADSVTDACKRQNCSPKQLFQQAAERGHNGRPFSNADEVATKWYQVWCRSGYAALPPLVKDFVLECNERNSNKGLFNQLVFPFK